MLINLRNALMTGKRLPYDAEVEYLRVDAVGPYIVIGGVTYCDAVGTYYAFTISSGGVVTHDLIPVRRGNTGYMYDRITNKRFGNAGTGDFTLGPDVVPVEYIESHGTEWIDPNDRMEYGDDFEFDFKINNMRSNPNSYSGGYVLGGAVSSQRSYALGWYWGGSPSAYHFLFCFSNDASSYTRFPTPTANTRYAVKCHAESGNMQMTVNGTTYTDTATNASQSGRLALFARASAVSGDAVSSVNVISFLTLFSVIHKRNGTAIRHFVPVRVGTDATSWEGAMMDVLTRRIYRNAGTGAFTYGNDLKYPIPAE